MKQRSLILMLLLVFAAAVVRGQGHVAGQSIELTLGQWATFSPGEAITIPQYNESSFPVYVASATLSGDQAYLITHQLNADGAIKVPLGTGLLMMLQQGDSPRWFDFEAAGGSPSALEQNALYGTTEAKVTSTLDHHNEGAILALNKNTQTFCVVAENVTFPAYKAYIALTLVNDAPAIRLVTEGEIVTGIESGKAVDDSSPTKFFRDGQLYISREGATYDALGRMVK